MYFNTFRRRQFYDRKKIIVVRNAFVRLEAQRHDYETQISASSISQVPE